VLCTKLPPLTRLPSKHTWKNKYCPIRNCTTRWQSTRALRTSPALFWSFWWHLLLTVFRATTHVPRYRPQFTMKYARRTGCGSSGRSPGTPALEQKSTAWKYRWFTGSTSGGTTSGARRRTPSHSKNDSRGRWVNGWWGFILRLPLVNPEGNSISDSEKSAKFAHNLEAQLQPVTEPSFPGCIEIVDVALRSYFMTPTSEPQLTTLRSFGKQSRVSRSAKLRARKVSRTGSWSISHSERYPPASDFDAILFTHHFRTVWKQARLICILNPEKDSAQSSSYRPFGHDW